MTAGFYAFVLLFAIPAGVCWAVWDGHDTEDLSEASLFRAGLLLTALAFLWWVAAFFSFFYW